MSRLIHKIKRKHTHTGVVNTLGGVINILPPKRQSATKQDVIKNCLTCDKEHTHNNVYCSVTCARANTNKE